MHLLGDIERREQKLVHPNGSVYDWFNNATVDSRGRVGTSKRKLAAHFHEEDSYMNQALVVPLDYPVSWSPGWLFGKSSFGSCPLTCTRRVRRRSGSLTRQKTPLARKAPTNHPPL